MTKSISADGTSISVVLLFIRILSKAFSEHHDDHRVCTMNRKIDASLEKRFSDAKEHENLGSLKILTKATIAEKVKSLIHEKICHAIRKSDSHNKSNNEVEPSLKQPCSQIWNLKF